ncbi:unnamed protein product [Kuraishia capsulata CBS 1993]|uniref:DH domain-containing protein n=1 Tax=Kuraishia capsulata CBS 1993 TaxID=1382522 RepID=W6MH65_9ASCO|nr:uncharacterized protein KUCA_T00000950001 [Kuraishia capsulata CBS 1993]CDK24983.1 unnamed protein product [Kuraishia capsulata CBS 1993]
MDTTIGSSTSGHTDKANGRVGLQQGEDLENDNFNIKNVLNALSLTSSSNGSPDSANSFWSGSNKTCSVIDGDSAYPEASALARITTDKLTQSGEEEIQKLVSDLKSLSVTDSHSQSNLDLRPEAQQSAQNSGSPVDRLNASKTQPGYSPLSAGICHTQISANYKRHRIVQELYQTERVYLCSLKLLLEVYVKPISIEYLNAVPVMGFQAVLEKMIESHSILLWDIKTLCSRLSGTEFGISPASISSDYELYKRSEADDVTGKPVFISSFVEILEKSAIPVYIYVEYCSRHSRFVSFTQGINIAKYSEKLWSILKKDEYWNLGSKAQTSYNNMDLSFNSLVQKPLVRSGKYRLILESLRSAELSSQVCDPFVLERIETALSIIKQQLNQINQNLYKSINRAELVQRLLGLNTRNRAILSEHFQMPISSSGSGGVDYRIFGDPILCGSMDAIWIESKGTVMHQAMAMLLFKSHVLLANSSGDVKFIVPLSVCKILKGAPEFDSGGLTLLNSIMVPKHFKLVFERKYCIYEILLVSHSLLETEIWKYYMDLLIYHVNGSYKFDFSYSLLCSNTGFRPLIHTPVRMSPITLLEDRFDPKNVIHKNCYFSYVFLISILSNGSDSQEIPSSARLLRLNADDKHAIDVMLGPLRSREFPAPIRTLRRTNRRPDLGFLRSSPSWSSIRLPAALHKTSSTLTLSSASVMSQTSNGDQYSATSSRDPRRTLTRSQSLRDVFRNVFKRTK